MVLAAEDNHAVVAGSGTAYRTSPVPIIASALGALVLMILAGNCFLKYLWWTAKYSALAGIPKVVAQWQAAGTRASFYGWSLLLLEFVSVLLLFGLIRFRLIGSSKLGIALRILFSLVITVLGTGLLALVLSWIKQASP